MFSEPAANIAKLGLVDSAIPSLVDNKVRRVIVKYKNKGEKGYRISERPAGKGVLVVPIENQQYIWIKKVNKKYL